MKLWAETKNRFLKLLVVSFIAQAAQMAVVAPIEDFSRQTPRITVEEARKEVPGLDALTGREVIQLRDGLYEFIQLGLDIWREDKRQSGMKNP